MNFSYFRKSKYSIEETIENAIKETEKAGFKVLNQVEISNGKMLLICKKEWAEMILENDYNLIAFLPCSITVFKKDKNVMIGTGTASVIKALAKTKTNFELAQNAEEEIKKIIETSAGTGPLKPTKIKLYSTTTCPYCKMEKQWLEQNKIEHELVFVDLNPGEAQNMVEKTGQMGVPVTEIQYEDAEPEFIIGFDKDKLSHIVGA